MRTLVTGGAGFMGSHVADVLLASGQQVVVLDDLSGGFVENVDRKATFVEGSILDNDLVLRLFDEHRFDYVFHLAAYAAEGLSHFIRRFNYNNNLIGSVNLINNQLTVGANGQLQAEVNAKSIVVIGRVQGNLTASERVEIQATGIVDGDITTPVLLVQEGATMNGRIDMSKAAAPTGKQVSGSPVGESPTDVRKSA